MLQGKILEGQTLSAHDDRLWHGKTNHSGWVPAQGLFFPRVCVSPQYSKAPFASDSQQDAVLSQGFAQALRHSQEAKLGTDVEGEL